MNLRCFIIASRKVVVSDVRISMLILCCAEYYFCEVVNFSSMRELRRRRAHAIVGNG